MLCRRCARAVRKVGSFPPPVATDPKVLNSAPCSPPPCWYTRDFFVSMMLACPAGPEEFSFTALLALFLCAVLVVCVCACACMYFCTFLQLHASYPPSP